MGEALSNAQGASMKWLDSQLQRADSWPLFIAPPDNPQFNRSKIEASGERKNRIPTLVEMAARMMIANREADQAESISLRAKVKRILTHRKPPQNKTPELLLDVQHLLLQHTKNLGEYRELVCSGWIENQVQSAFCRTKLEEKGICLDGEGGRLIRPINGFLLQAHEQALIDQRAKEIFFEVFLLNSFQSMSIEEKRGWIFASRHTLTAPFVLFIFKVKRVVLSLWAQWIAAFNHGINSPLLNRWQPASFKVWRMGLLPILYTIYRVAFRVQSCLWKVYFTPFIRAGFHPGLYGVKPIMQIAFFIFNHQLGLVLGSSFLRAWFLHCYPRSTRIHHQVIGYCLTLAQTLALGPNFIFTPFIVLSLSIYLLAKKVFRSSFSHRVYEKAHRWIWPLLEASPTLSKPETDYIRHVADFWGKRFAKLNREA